MMTLIMAIMLVPICDASSSLSLFLSSRGEMGSLSRQDEDEHKHEDEMGR